jgi:hypothetical protein
MILKREFHSEKNQYILPGNIIARTSVFQLSDITNILNSNNTSVSFNLHNDTNQIIHFDFYFVEFFNENSSVIDRILQEHLILTNFCKTRERKSVKFYKNFYLSENSSAFIFGIFPSQSGSRVQVELEIT